MDFNNKKQLIIYLVAGGFVFYMLAAMLGSIFIIGVPQDKDWCLNTMEIQVSESQSDTKCIEFKNEFEQAKYYHNMEMVTRNKYITVSLFILAFILTHIIFYSIPKWKGKPNTDYNFLAIAGMAFSLSILGPMVFGWFLPAPIGWFPQVFRDIQDAQVEKTLRILR